MTAPPVLQFTPGASGVGVDLERLISSRALVQADSGGGKSWLLRYIIEQLYGRVQIVVLDPEGEFATLRERHDFLLAAGDDGDVRADPKTAKLLARRVLELSASAIVDIYELQLPARRKYVRLFLEELMHAPRKLWRPLLVFIDEAHTFAPQTGDAESLSAIVSLCTLGRKRGFAAVLATQRISKLHKDAAAELKNKFIGSCGLDLDMKRAGDELGFDKDGRLQLRSMQPGTFYTFGPAISERGVNLVRSGPVKTTHPEPGAIAPPAPPPPAAVKKLLGQMKDLEREAEDEARSIEDLQRQLAAEKSKVRKLERGVSKPLQTETVVDEKAIARAVATAERQLRNEFNQAQLEQRGVDRQLRTQITTLGKQLGRIGGLAGQIVQLCGVDLGEVAAAAPVKPNGSAAAAPGPVPRPEKRTIPLPTTERASRRTAVSSSTDGIGTPEQRILNALATYEGFGMDVVERDAAAAMGGYKPGSGHVNNTVGRLSSAGLVEIPSGGMLALTDAGRAIAEADEVRSLADVHAIWMGLLNGPQQKILQVLLEDYPDPVDRNELAARAGFQPGSGHVNNTIGSLTKLKAATVPVKGQVAASALLFPEGLS